MLATISACSEFMPPCELRWFRTPLESAAMRRLSMLILILLVGACASARPEAAAGRVVLANSTASAWAQDTGSGSGTDSGTGDQPTTRPGKSEGGARAVEWLWKGPLNLVWWPWKIVGKSGRGLVDGVSAGFAEGRVPIIGLAVSPVNAALGLVSGMAEGIGMGPGLMTPETDAGRAFSKPLSVPTSIWWY
jgi:hypothetical protein